MKYLGGIEAGGTKIVCGLGTAEGKVVDRTSFPTTTPEETMEQVIAYFKGKDMKALGVGSFGPLDPHPASPSYGCITSTPKPYWRNFNVLGALKEHFDVPMAFDTDVNAAALGEATWGAAKGLDSCLYITIGTGIGAGAVVNGRIVQGFSHTEMGHILLRRHADDSYEGRCPFHHDCFEGLAAGPAIEARWGRKGIELASDHPAWELEAYYAAQALMNYILILMPKKIIMGGGVMKQKQLFPLIQKKLVELMNGYIEHPNLLGKLDEYIVAPQLEDNAGLLGAIALARLAE